MLLAIQRQFLITFAAMGAVLAYLPLVLKGRLTSEDQVGLVMSTTGLAIILTPVVMTALADTKLQSRSLIAVLFAVSSVTCFWQAASFSFVGLLVSHTVFAFFFWPLAALQDGLVFADNQRAQAAGRAATPYHRVRVFGTVGFALPLAGLYFLIGAGYDASVALILGGIVCALGAVNALSLPHTTLGSARRAQAGRKQPVTEVSGGAGGTGVPPVKTNLQHPHGRDARATMDTEQAEHPTRAAARVLFRGPALIFCVCLFIAHLGNSAYYAFYPIYLRDTVGFDDKWVGPITMLGVVLELGVMTTAGLMSARLGLKRLLIIGLSMMVLRFALLGFWPAQHVAVWTQVLHGITVIGIYVVPPIYLNTLARDHFRSSIHGLYAMVVFGPGRIVGNVLGGVLAVSSLPVMFQVSAATTLVAVLGLALAMRSPRVDAAELADEPAAVDEA